MSAEPFDTWTPPRARSLAWLLVFFGLAVHLFIYLFLRLPSLDTPAVSPPPPFAHFATNPRSNAQADRLGAQALLFDPLPLFLPTPQSAWAASISAEGPGSPLARPEPPPVALPESLPSPPPEPSPALQDLLHHANPLDCFASAAPATPAFTVPGRLWRLQDALGRTIAQGPLQSPSPVGEVSVILQPAQPAGVLLAQGSIPDALAQELHAALLRTQPPPGYYRFRLER